MSRNQSRAAESRREPDPTPRGPRPSLAPPQLAPGAGFAGVRRQRPVRFHQKEWFRRMLSGSRRAPDSDLVLKRVVTAAEQLTDFCFRHQGRALGYFIEELPKRLQFLTTRRTPEAPKLGLGGDDIGLLPPLVVTYSAACPDPPCVPGDSWPRRSSAPPRRGRCVRPPAKSRHGRSGL